MVHTDVGVRCRDCAPPRPAIAGTGSTRLRNVVIVVGLVFVAVVLIGGGSQLGGGSDDFDDYEGYADQFLEEFEPDVRATRMIDPWQSDAPDDRPGAERRLVALEVTIVASDEYPHYVTSSSFKLIDQDDFAYGTTESLLEPALPEGLELAAGEKTRGWVMFEIDEGTEIKSVAYGAADVELPDQSVNPSERSSEPARVTAR